MKSYHHHQSASSLSHNQISSPLVTTPPSVQTKAASKASTTTRSRCANSANICARIHWLSLTLSALPSEIAQILSELDIDSQAYGSPMRNHEARYHRLQTFEHGIRLLQTLSEDRRQELRLEIPGSLFDNLPIAKQRQLLRRLDAYVTSCSRIDLAIDSSNSITIDQLADKVHDERRRQRKGKQYQSLVTRCQTFNDIDASGRTLYVGSKNAEHLLRCYEPRTAALRLESQSRGDTAYRRYLALQDAIGATTDDQSYLASIYELAASAITSLIEWKTPSSAGKQTSRRPRAPWFRKIVSSNTKRIKLPQLPQAIVDRRDAKRLDSINRREYRLQIDRLIAAAQDGSARALIAVCRPCPSTLSSSQRRMIAALLEAQGLTREDVLAAA